MTISPRRYRLTSVGLVTVNEPLTLLCRPVAMASCAVSVNKTSPQEMESVQRTITELAAKAETLSSSVRARQKGKYPASRSCGLYCPDTALPHALVQRHVIGPLD